MRTDRIQNQLVYSTTRIIATDGKIVSCGTGFFVADPAYGGSPYLVTNKHVVGNFNIGRFTFCRADENGNPLDNSHVTIIITDLQNRCINHPDSTVDLCFIKLQDEFDKKRNAGETPFFTFVAPDYFLNTVVLDNMTSIENVVMIGYPESIMDQVNNKPVVRKGITATSLALDYNGKKEFMVDIAAFHGSSGSPVFVETTGLTQQNSEYSISFGSGVSYCLAGVLYAMPARSLQGEIKIIDVPTDRKLVSEAELNTNLGYVIKVERIQELLESTHS